MANTNNNYPQSSTNSYQCTKNNYVFSDGVPTNMSVRSCDFPSYYECYDKKIFKWDTTNYTKQELTGHNGYVLSVNIDNNSNIISGGTDNTIKVWN